MKNLFYIHSPITYLVSIEIIKYLQLDPGNCVFIITRSKQEDYKEIGIKMVGLYIESFPLYRKFWKSWRRVARLDNYIKAITQNDDFAFYTPHTYADFLSLIVTHKNCKGYNIIEEGMGSYVNKSGLEKRFPKKAHGFYTKLLWKLNFSNRLKINRKFIEDDYNHAFGLTPHAFPGYDRRIVLGLPSREDYNSVMRADGGDVSGNILVYDALVESNILDADVLVRSTSILLQRLVENNEKKLFVKYHPDQISAGKTINLLRELFQQTSQIEVVEIGPNVSLEEIAMKRSSTFYVFVSSVALYASFYGCKVFSLWEVVKKLSPSLLKRDNLPEIFKQNVRFI